jgi:hypothetical protein
VAVAVIVGVVIATSRSVSGGSHPALAARDRDPRALGHLAKPGSRGSRGSEGVAVPSAPPLAPPGSPWPGQIVDGIQCQCGEETLFHVHTHLTVFVDGEPRQIPYGVGIAPPPQVQRTAVGPFVGVQIQLDVGRPLVAPEQISFPNDL